MPKEETDQIGVQRPTYRAPRGQAARGDSGRGDLRPPIFVIGNVRSGTSMLHDLFDLHPDVCGWYEPRTVWVYADPGRRHDRFVASDATPRVRRYIRRRFERYARRHGDRRIMEKTPSNVLRVPYVDAIFPESSFLYVIRHPLSMLRSSEKKWKETIHLRHALDRLAETPTSQLHHYLTRFAGDFVRRKILRRPYVSVWGVRYEGIYEDLRRMSVEEVIAHQWVKCARQAEADLAAIDPKRVMRIRYEDFVVSPVEIFGRVCDHFGLPMTDELSTALTKQIDPGRRARWQEVDPDVLERCRPILEEEMARHGYNLSEATGGVVDAPEGFGGPEAASAPGDARRA